MYRLAFFSMAATGAPLQPNTAQGSKRPEKEPVAPFQRRTGGSPGHKLFGRRPRGPQLPRLGHATVAFTLDEYGHVTPAMKQDSADRMQRLIDSCC